MAGWNRELGDRPRRRDPPDAAAGLDSEPDVPVRTVRQIRRDAVGARDDERGERAARRNAPDLRVETSANQTFPSEPAVSPMGNPPAGTVKAVIVPVGVTRSILACA